MGFSSGSRLFLVALLPVIGLAVYLEGQRYDPALIQFSSPEGSVAPGEDFFPESIGDFSLAGEVREFTAENLYEYVNGHAEYFLSAGFQGLVVGEYSRAGADPSEPGVIVDIYDMGRGLQAFGVFADEVGNATSDVTFGEMSARTTQGLNFVSGRHYVRIASFGKSIPVEGIAAGIDEMIASSPAASTAFSRFPAVGRVAATRFVKESYRGLEFARDVIERKYDFDGKTVHLSLAQGDAASMKDLIKSYLAFFRESGVEYAAVEGKSQKLYRVSDPYEGDWHLVPMTDAVFGVYGEIDEETLELILTAMSPAGER